jgi:hypothetical protein
LNEPATTIGAVYVESNVVGKYLIAPAWDEPYDRGFNPMVVDIYEPLYQVVGDKELAFWFFRKRIRQYSKPIHRDHYGREIKCKECESWYKKLGHKRGRCNYI